MTVLIIVNIEHIINNNDLTLIFFVFQIYVVSQDQKLYCASTNPPEQFEANSAVDFARYDCLIKLYKSVTNTTNFI